MSRVSQAFEVILLQCVLIGIVLKDELEITMRMMGVTDLSKVHPGMSNTRAVGSFDSRWRGTSLCQVET
jgi:hypothetical protein